MSEAEYPQADLLVDPAWVAEHVGDVGVRIIDCAAVEAYRRAHIPGAVGLAGADPYIKDPNNSAYVMPADAFARLMGELGVGDDTLVVTYDDNNSLMAARLWWVLQYYGHSNAKILNGGWHRWVAENRPITTHATRPDPAVFTPAPNEAVMCRIDHLKDLIGSSKGSVLDVRSDEEFAGTNLRGNSRAGHVPGAKHIEWLDFVTSDDRRVFKPAAEIRAMLEGAGIHPEQEVVTY
jgi:thiosulfate/3-mercaptopyruvate sulfurtransferase